MRDMSENRVQKNHLLRIIFVPYKNSDSRNTKTLHETWKPISSQIKRRIRISKISEITWSQLICLLNSKENLINSRAISIHIKIVSIVTISM